MTICQATESYGTVTARKLHVTSCHIQGHVPIPEDTGILAFAAAAEFAAAVAEALNTVCGTRRGISGTSLLPSAAHSAQLPAP